jgi:hypothetical protein
MISSLSSLGYPIRDTKATTLLYNNNKACIKWCHNMTTKGNRHIEQCKNAVQEWVADSTLTVLHVSGKTNTANIFTKEMRGGANFQCLRDSLMCHSIDYNKRLHSSVDSSPTLAQTVQYIKPSCPGLLKVLLSHRCFCIPEANSCLSILSCITSSLPLQALMSDPMGRGSGGSIPPPFFYSGGKIKIRGAKKERKKLPKKRRTTD